MFSTVLMLSIIQGLYILREDEGEELEKRRNKKKRNQQKNDPGAKKTTPGRRDRKTKEKRQPERWTGNPPEVPRAAG